jgi:hypothetical protein
MYKEIQFPYAHYDAGNITFNPLRSVWLKDVD